MQTKPARAGTITQSRGMDAAAGDGETEGRRADRQVELTEAEGEQRLVVDRRRREFYRYLAEAEVHRPAFPTRRSSDLEVAFGGQDRAHQADTGSVQRGLGPVDGGG